jgi:hypothetical protein
LVELNPFLDERGRTALLMVDLVASLSGDAFSTAQPELPLHPQERLSFAGKVHQHTGWMFAYHRAYSQKFRSFRSFRFCEC